MSPWRKHGHDGDDAAGGSAKDLAKIIAKRGVPGQATIVALAPTGAERHGGVGREIEFELQLTVGGETHRPVLRQFMNDLTMTGLAAGEPAAVQYDRDDPCTLIVMQSPKYVFLRNPNAAFDGQSMLAVPAAGPADLPQY
jgi:hypothetical protein